MKNQKKPLNIPDAKLPRKPHTQKEIAKDSRDRVSRINREFMQGFTFIKKFPKSVTFFGSSRFKKGNRYFQKARFLAQKIAKLDYAIVTGGGPGIMEAANLGAQEARGKSVGLNIQLPNEQVTNPYITYSSKFYYFFSRKVVLSFSAEAYLFFPGGFGTLDEFFEIVTLVQTRKITKVPIILVGNEFWKPLDKFIQNQLVNKHKTIDKRDAALYKILDNENEILKIIKSAPLRNE